jgi:hypothetical protein
MLPVQAEAAEAFYRIIDAAYERRSIAVTSNIRPSDFDTIMPKSAGARGLAVSVGKWSWSPRSTPLLV